MAPVDFIQKPLRWLETISRLGATVSGGPNFAYELMFAENDAGAAGTFDLRSGRSRFPVRNRYVAKRWSGLPNYFATMWVSKRRFTRAMVLAEGTLLVSGGRRKKRRSCGRLTVKREVRIASVKYRRRRKAIVAGSAAVDCHTEKQKVIAQYRDGQRCARGMRSGRSGSRVRAWRKGIGRRGADARGVSARIARIRGKDRFCARVTWDLCRMASCM